MTRAVVLYNCILSNLTSNLSFIVSPQVALNTQGFECGRRRLPTQALLGCAAKVDCDKRAYTYLLLNRDQHLVRLWTATRRPVK